MTSRHTSTHSIASPVSPNAIPAGTAHSRPGHLALAEHRCLASKRLAREARDACGLSQDELAAVICVRRKLVSDWENPTHPQFSPNLEHVRRAPVPYRRHIVRALAAIDGEDVVLEAAVVHGDNQPARVAAVICAFANCNRALVRTDDAPTYEQLELLVRDTDTAIESAREARAWARQRLAVLRGGGR